jgi:hypothetical protein
MRSYDETVFFPDPILNFQYFIICELKGPSTADAPQVAMMFMTIDMFIMEVAILEIDLLDQAAFDKEGEGSVNRSLGKYLVLFSHTKKKLIHIEVVVDRKNFFNDHLPFWSVP